MYTARPKRWGWSSHWGRKREHRRHARRLGQTQQLIANPGQTGHEAGRCNPQRVAAARSIVGNALEDRRGDPVARFAPSFRIERPGGFKYEIEVAKITVTERAVVAEPGGQGRLDCDLDLGSDRGIVKVAQQAEASQANPRRPADPGSAGRAPAGAAYRQAEIRS